MTWQEFDRRHGERYAKIMRREMTLTDALAENEKDWRALVDAGWHDAEDKPAFDEDRER